MSSLPTSGLAVSSHGRIHVEVLSSADVAAYRSLMLEAYAMAPDAFTSTPEERAVEPESWWVKRLADPSGYSAAFGAFNETGLVGTVALEFSPKPKIRHKGGRRRRSVGSIVRNFAMQLRGRAVR